jgi:hypothetical protein
MYQVAATVYCIPSTDNLAGRQLSSQLHTCWYVAGLAPTAEFEVVAGMSDVAPVMPVTEPAGQVT